MLPPFVLMMAVLLLAAPLVYIAGRVLNAHVSRGVVLSALAVAWVFLILAVRAGPAEFYMQAIALRFDGVAQLLAALTLTLGTLAALFSVASRRAEPHTEKFLALFLILLGVLIALGAAADLFNLWVWFETLAVVSYVLVAFEREQNASLEAGVKYLVQGAAGSVLVLLGIALVLGATGTLDLETIRNRAAAAPNPLVLTAAMALFVTGFGVKAALIPLHTWLPDAHAQAPSGISVLLSGVVIEAGLIAMLRTTVPISTAPGEPGNALALLLLGFGAVNMLAGNLLALRQVQVKRLLAFSSIAQMGFILFGFGFSFWDGQDAGAQGAFFHVLTHGLMKGLAFLAAGGLLFALHSALGNHAPLANSDLAGTARRYPLVALGLSVALLGLGGLPPLAGFMSKWQIFAAGFDAGNVWLALLVLFAALNSVLSLAYYAPLVNAMYRREPSPVVLHGGHVPFAMTAPLLVLSVSVFVIGVAPNVMNWLTQPASAALMRSFP